MMVPCTIVKDSSSMLNSSVCPNQREFPVEDGINGTQYMWYANGLSREGRDFDL